MILVRLVTVLLLFPFASGAQPAIGDYFECLKATVGKKQSKGETDANWALPRSGERPSYEQIVLDSPKPGEVLFATSEGIYKSSFDPLVNSPTVVSNPAPLSGGSPGGPNILKTYSNAIRAGSKTYIAFTQFHGLDHESVKKTPDVYAGTYLRPTDSTDVKQEVKAHEALDSTSRSILENKVLGYLSTWVKELNDRKSGVDWKSADKDLNSCDFSGASKKFSGTVLRIRNLLYPGKKATSTGDAQGAD